MPPPDVAMESAATSAAAYRLSPQQRDALHWLAGAAGTAGAAADTGTGDAAGSPRAAVLIAGELDSGRLTSSIRRVLARHEIFRTSFRRAPGLATVVQFVAEDLHPEAGRLLAGGELAEAPADWLPWLAGLPGRAFREDLGECFRTEVFALPGDRRVAVFTASPLCADLWTVGELARLIAEEYLGAGAPASGHSGNSGNSGNSDNRGDTAPDLQYADYADWRNELLESPADPAARRLCEFWARQPSAREPAPVLPLDRAASTAGSPAGACLGVPLAAGAAESLAAAAGGGADAEAALLAGWQAFLARYSGLREVEIDCLSTGRHRPEIERLLGNVALWLPCRARLDAARPLVRLVQAAAAGLAERRRHEDGYPAAGRPEPAAPPIRFELHRGWPPRAERGVGISLLALAGGAGPYSLKLSCFEGEHGRQLWLFCAPGRMGAAETATLRDALAAFLAAAADAPALAVDRVSLLTERDRRLLPALQSAPAPAVPAVPIAKESPASVLAAFDRQAAAAPARMAVVGRAGDQLTYEQLSRRAAQLARVLAARGAGPEKLVGIALGRSPELVVAMLAAWRTGAAYVPVPTDTAAERMLARLDPASLAVIVTTAEHGASLPSGTPRLLLDEARAAIADQPAERFGEAPDPRALAYVLLTSGSTGKPKPVGVSHGAIGSYTRAIVEALELGLDGALPPAPRPASFAFVSSPHADLGNTCIFPALASGGCLHLFQEDEILDAAAFGRRVREQGIDVLKIVPSHFASLLAAGGAAVMPRRLLVLGGEAIGEQLAERIAHAAGDCRVINHYGPTEATVGCVLYKLPAVPRPAARPAGGRRPPIGRPLAGVQVRVMDAWGEPAPVGAVGELWVGGAGLARGYLGDPAATAERFVPDAWVTASAAPLGAPAAGSGGGRLYRTGDRVRWRADGMLEYLGRLDQQVKIRGHRVEPGEVESALRALPGVREAVVVARAEERRPEELRLVAYVIGTAGGEEQWRAALRRLLPEPMVPAALVRLERLPLTANGKVDRRSLPAPEAAVGAAPWEPPRTAVEQALAEIWSELLGCGRVGRDDNFFELGGDSILSIQAVARARQRGLWLTPRQVFDQPTIRGLAAVAATAAPDEQAPAAAANRSPGDFPLARLSGEELARLTAAVPDLADVYPLTPLQAGLLFHALHSPESNAYCNQMVCTLEGELDGERLRRAWEQVAARHETLRTVFVWEAVREPVQAVRRSPPLPWRYEDWRGVDEAEQRRRLERTIAADRAQGYELERGPLQRLALIRTGERRHAFLWSNHHLILDGWSRTLTIAELLQRYAALAPAAATAAADTGAVRQEPAPPFREYVAWLQRQDRGAAEAYWRERLAGVEPSLVAERAAGGSPPGGHQKRRGHLDLAASRRLEDFARHARVTLNTLVQAAWALVLGGLRGADEVVFGVTVAGRPAGLAGVDRMVGLFINTLPVRVRLAAAGEELDAWLRDLQRQAAAAREFEYSPLSDVMRWSGQPAGRRLFDSLLVFESFPALPAAAVAEGVQVTGGEAIDHNNYPLTVTVRPAAPIEIEIDFIADAVAESLVQRLLSAIAGVLGRLAAGGDGATVAALRQEMKAMAKKEAEMATQSRRDSLLEKMRSTVPRPVQLESPLAVVEVRPYAPPATLPLLVEPRLAGVDLFAWAREHRDHLYAALHRAGALLLRGAGAPSPERLQELASIFSSDLFDDNGEHPRESIAGHVFTPVHFSPKHLLLWHNENSFNKRWPRLIWFCCVRPADRGGDSILVDSRQVFSRLPPSLREPFVDLGVTYVRKYGEGVGRDWQDVFQTTSQADVEERCRRDGLELRWLDERRLVTSCRRPAVVAHPITGETCWFNQAQHWHPSCLAAEVRGSLAGAFEAGSYPRDCLYGDGTPIADSTMAAICAVYRELEVSVPLGAGEVLMVDNVLAAHARAPYEGERRLLVAMAETGSFAD